MMLLASEVLGYHIIDISHFLDAPSLSMILVNSDLNSGFQFPGMDIMYQYVSTCVTKEA